MPRIIDPYAGYAGAGGGYGYAGRPAIVDTTPAAIGGGVETAAAAIAQALQQSGQNRLEIARDKFRGELEKALMQQRLDAERSMQESRQTHEKDMFQENLKAMASQADKNFGADMITTALAGQNKLVELMMMDETNQNADAREMKRLLLSKNLDWMDQAEQSAGQEVAKAKGVREAARASGWGDAKKAYDSIMGELGDPESAKQWAMARTTSKLLAPITGITNPWTPIINHDEFEKALNGRISQTFSQIDATNIPAKAKDGLKAQIVQDLRRSFNSGSLLSEEAVGEGVGGKYALGGITLLAAPFGGGPLSDWFSGALDKSIESHRSASPNWNPNDPFKLVDAMGDAALEKLPVEGLQAEQRSRVEHLTEYKREQLKKMIGATNPQLAAQLDKEQPARRSFDELRRMNGQILKMGASLRGMDPKVLDALTAEPDAPAPARAVAPASSAPAPAAVQANPTPAALPDVPLRYAPDGTVILQRTPVDWGKLLPAATQPAGPQSSAWSDDPYSSIAALLGGSLGGSLS